MALLKLVLDSDADRCFLLLGRKKLFQKTKKLLAKKKFAVA